MVGAYACTCTCTYTCMIHDASILFADYSILVPDIAFVHVLSFSFCEAQGLLTKNITW